MLDYNSGLSVTDISFNGWILDARKEILYNSWRHIHILSHWQRGRTGTRGAPKNDNNLNDIKYKLESISLTVQKNSQKEKQSTKNFQGIGRKKVSSAERK